MLIFVQLLKGKAIVMTSIDTEIEQAEAWNYGVNLPVKENPMKKETVKGSQFEQPLFGILRCLCRLW